MEFKQEVKRFWNFVWNGDSIWSWIVSLALAFIIVKFIFFPLLSLIFSTPLPLVVIESGSMYHDGSFFKDLTGIGITSSDKLDNWFKNNGEWYIQHNISLEDFQDFRYNWGMDRGDIIVVRGKNSEDLNVGDVIIFDAGQNHPIIHRIISKRNENGVIHFSTKGDNNAGQLVFEKDILPNQILGKAVLRINKIGWVKLIPVLFFNRVFN